MIRTPERARAESDMDPELHTKSWVLSDTRAYIVITAIYLGSGVGFAGLFKLIEYWRGYDDIRNVEGTIVIGAILGVMWLLSIRRIHNSGRELRELAAPRRQNVTST